MESKRLPAPAVISPEIQELSRQIEQWRGTRLHRMPMPDPLWELAANLARQYGVTGRTIFAAGLLLQNCRRSLRRRHVHEFDPHRRSREGKSIRLLDDAAEARQGSEEQSFTVDAPELPGDHRQSRKYHSPVGPLYIPAARPVHCPTYLKTEVHTLASRTPAPRRGTMLFPLMRRIHSSIPIGLSDARFPHREFCRKLPILTRPLKLLGRFLRWTNSEALRIDVG
jgi:hypothetical protein